MMNRGGQNSSVFIVDTNALYWYLRRSTRLSVAANAIFRLVETGNAVLVVPAIVVAEYYYLSFKLGNPLSPTELYERLGNLQGVYFSELGRNQFEVFHLIDDIPEMHDKLIAAEAVALEAPIVTRDAVIRQSRHVQTIW